MLEEKKIERERNIDRKKRKRNRKKDKNGEIEKYRCYIDSKKKQKLWKG